MGLAFDAIEDLIRLLRMLIHIDNLGIDVFPFAVNKFPPDETSRPVPLAFRHDVDLIRPPVIFLERHGITLLMVCVLLGFLVQSHAF